MSMRRLYLIKLLLFAVTVATAATRTLDDIRRVLEESSSRQVQEKVYIHTDNNCYFVGDTLWYKAYVVRADDLRFTDMSRILYVELLTPDGLLVERQNIIVSPQGYTCGNFCLKDSLYSGYYELRAYTRWMLNFNVSVRRFQRDDGLLFGNKQMARDYFRKWDGLYSRVFPVYSKPEKAGDFTYRRMYQRPKQRLPKPKADKLDVTFYPEGGSLVEGVKNRVAFEIVDQYGQAVSVNGTVQSDDTDVATISPVYMGRGTFTVTPGENRMKAVFAWKGKTYSFALPKAEKAGVSLLLDGNQLSLTAKGLPGNRQYGLSVLCRGVLKHFQEVSFDAGGEAVLQLPPLPTGVNNVTLFDTDGRILADRLFFVNNHDRQGGTVSIESGHKIGYAPYEQIQLGVKAEGITSPMRLSVAVRDTRTDEASYDDSNIMTDLLLGSELKGFVARPSYYFEADDAGRRQALDLLMMVQGWRKYKWDELADTLQWTKRYQPETTMTVAGSVYKMLSIPQVWPEEIGRWIDGVGKVSDKIPDDETTPESTDEATAETYTTDQFLSTVAQSDESSTIEYGDIGLANELLGINHGVLRHEVLVEAELVMGTDVVGSVQKTKNGRFLFQIPPYYGDAYLNMKAYSEKDSLKKNMQSRTDADIFNENAYADYFVKRDLFYPVFAQKYNYYQNHQPDYEIPLETDSLSEFSMENETHLLKNVNVKGKRRGKRGIDRNKPAYVCDAYEMYNTITDYGLSMGKYDMRQFPVRVCHYLYGNMGRYKSFNVDGRLDGYTYYRNYNKAAAYANAAMYEQSKIVNRTPQALYNSLLLKRLQNIRVYSDYEPRNEDSTMVTESFSADATVDFEPIPMDGKQITFRDRHIILHGMTEPAEFYSPDYSTRTPAKPTDYRRTLYWNPNALTDEEGRFTATFFNNSKETRIKISAAGITPDGRLVYTDGK